ncbi:MAG: PGF-pre-PGF domain-containing protein [Methanofollis sp.]|nr:PGF-pre-PGF domain-containing protein [Methanofollis sp.]
MLIATAMLLLLMTLMITPAAAEPLPEPNHIFINVANDASVRYDLDGVVYGTEGNNNTYYIKVDGGGLNELCLTADPAVPTGQITVSDQQSGTFYVASSSGKGYFDDIIMAIAVNGTISDDFAVHIKSSGYNWTPSDNPSNYTYVTDVVDEVFTKEDFVYGPQVQRPCPPRKGLQPFVYGQNLSDTTNTFQFMFVDLHAGPLLNTFPGINDEGKGAVKVEYSFENLETAAAFNVYGWCLYAPQGQGISWTNDLIDQARGGSNGYSVVGIPPVLTSISISPGTAEVEVGEALQFAATALDQKDRPMDNVTFWWTSSDETVGTVNGTGYFTALSTGTTTITVANESIAGEATVNVTATPSGPKPLLDAYHIFVKMANDDGPKYDDFGNGTYYVKFEGGGLNALHITTDPTDIIGQVTETANQSGTFYLSYYGGRGYTNDAILMLAVNGTLREDFKVHLKSSGYVWPAADGKPTESNIQYEYGALEETFTTDDFIYGPQIWKPAGIRNSPLNYPIFYGQDMNDKDNTFHLMFIDLNAGLIGSTFLPDLKDGGAVRVEYSFENHEDLAAFNVYGWCSASNQGSGISWSNRLTGARSSGITVTGVPSEVTAISVLPETVEIKEGEGFQLNATALDQRDRQMTGVEFEWTSSDGTVGIVNETGYFTALSAGTTAITAAYGGISGEYTVSVTVPHGKQTKNASLDLPKCSIVMGDDGKMKIRVNVSESDTSVYGDVIEIRKDTYRLNIITESDPLFENGTLNGDLSGIILKTSPVRTSFEAIGTVSASIAANLTGLPEDAALETTVTSEILSGAGDAFQVAATDDGLKVNAVAYTMNIEKTNLANGKDIADATIQMTVSPAWVEAHGGVDAVRIIRSAEDGTKEVLKAVNVGTDADGNMVFEAFSPKGLSIFGLTAVSATSSGGDTVSSHSSGSSGGGSSNVAAISGSIPTGESHTFVVGETAINRITVEAYDQIDDLLVTVQKASLPKDIPVPKSQTYQLIETDLYHTDASAIGMVTFEFAVPVAWLKEHDLSDDDIVLLKYENERWKPLKTTCVKEENGQVLYSAEASGFSYFAIVAGEAASAAGQVDETEAPTPVVTGTPAPIVEETTAPVTTAPTQKSPVLWFLSLVAIGALFLVKRD